MKEEDAKAKWCPQIRFDSTGCLNRDEQHLTTNCIASDCMMWEWDLPPVFEGRGMANPAGHCGLVK